MIPTALAAQLRQGLADFLRFSFHATTPGLEGTIDQFLAAPDALLKGPYVSLKLPFVRSPDPSPLPHLPLDFAPHAHQSAAFARLLQRRSTLVATGTGSGKTESFLAPILDHCLQPDQRRPGIKAILVYPMNALATDQALRIARWIHRTPALHGVRAGLYIGESRKAHQQTMAPDAVITDRATLQAQPPDLLLTNYKMLDYLLIRPSDQRIWAHNGPGDLRFLVVDELHTFDGAQGTDLACLIRRLKRRLQVDDGSLCCIGTSATLGGSTEALIEYAAQVFGEPFGPDAVIGESRVTPAEFVAGAPIRHTQEPSPEDAATLDPTRHTSPAAWLQAQAALWLPDPPADRSALGVQLREHATFRALLDHAGTRTLAVSDLVAALARSRAAWRDDPAFGARCVDSLLALVAHARDPDGQRFVDLRVQLWQRELARMVATLATPPRLRHSDDLEQARARQHLPLVHCRDCGAMGWATRIDPNQPHVLRTELGPFYRAYFADDPRVHFLFPRDAVPAADPRWARQPVWRVDPDTLTLLGPNDAAPGALDVVPAPSVRSDPSGAMLSKDCPFCGARDALTLLGFRAATLSSVHIDQLFASPFNDDKKLLAFSDAVQDAAHRAGFFGARTWRANLRLAVARVVHEQPGLTLAALPAAVAGHWAARLDEPTYVATFLAPNLAWMEEWDRLRRTGAVSPGLRQLVDRRLAYEVAAELSLESRIGRSLPRVGVAVAVPDPVALAEAVVGAVEPIRNEVPGLRDATLPEVERLVRGLLAHLLAVGGVLHAELPDGYVGSAGRDTHVFARIPHLPGFGRTSRMPALLVDRPGSPRFDRPGTGWYARWADRVFEGRALGADATSLYDVLLPVLVRARLLAQRTGDKGERIWGLDPQGLRVVPEVARLRCVRCRTPAVIGAHERDAWDGLPCPSARCPGTLVPDHDPRGAWFARLYTDGDLHRIVAEEHTGLLDRTTREETERRFKAPARPAGGDTDPDDPRWRRPWDPNLLSCTPTLEMGIDIGDLSTAMLCSMPPNQAAFLQRIGRAGRRDGNALVLTVANARPHDQFFFASPEEMLEGQVEPPGVFLDTSAVLERQLSAYSFDRWVALAGEAAELPPTLRDVFAKLDASGAEQFPHSFTAFVGGRAPVLLREFVDLFAGRLSAHTIERLSAFLIGGPDERPQLDWRIVALLQTERDSRDSLAAKARALASQIRKLRELEARPLDLEEQIEALEAEKEQMQALVKGIDQRQTLEFLTDHGLLPNYAFPEAAVRLHSVIWRKKQRPPDKGSRYDTWTYDYPRSPGTALAEFAPRSDFYAGGRRVKIDQVDLAVSPIEVWRFCDVCTYADNGASMSRPTCPNCGSTNWCDDGQVVQMVPLKQVFASTSFRDSLIKDDRDDREPLHFQKDMGVVVEDRHRVGAWEVQGTPLPFGFELLRRATFREINFGRDNDLGAAKTTLGGRQAVRAGFRLCKHCGKVQDRRPNADPAHAMTCRTRSRATNPADLVDCLYLYREFHSEALRILLPVATLTSSKPLNSFLAAVQLGLRLRFRGKVDHLRSTVVNEPQPGTMLRRHYLVLYDTVPGGTGYLAQLVTPDADGELPLIRALELARDAIVGCSCWNDPDRDGCYRCLFAYRNSREMDDTSATEAFLLLSQILASSRRVVAIPALGAVSLDGLVDSALEARFLEALRQHVGADGAAAQLRYELIRGRKTGHRWAQGGAEWLIEPQVTERVDGVEVSIDFVLHVASADPERARTPIAVFLDGWEFHRDRVGWDLLQRQLLQATGRYDVWTLTWEDLDRALKIPVRTEPVDLIDRTNLANVYNALRVSAAHRQVQDVGTFALLVQELTGPERPWARMGEALGSASCRPARPGDADTWRQLVAARAPDALQALGQVVPKYTAFDDGDRSPHVRVATVRDGQRLCVLATLDDGEGHRDAPAYKAAWAGFLRLHQLLRAVPDVWFVTRSEQGSARWAAVARLRYGPADDVTASDWSTDPDLGDRFRPLASALCAAGAPAPVIGSDILSDRGRTWAEGELVWEEAKVAVLDRRRLAEARGQPAAGWRVLVLEALGDEVEPVLAALRGGA